MWNQITNVNSLLCPSDPGRQNPHGNCNYAFCLGDLVNNNLASTGWQSDYLATGSAPTT